jgi:prepilin-type N-terminal cleavage/methylation domain-containing protein
MQPRQQVVRELHVIGGELRASTVFRALDGTREAAGFRRTWWAAQTAGCGFTLVELIVVIAVIGILASLLLPVLRGAKQKAIRAQCLVKVRELNLAVLDYASGYNDRLPSWDLPWACSMPKPIADWSVQNKYNKFREVLECGRGSAALCDASNVGRGTGTRRSHIPVQIGQVERAG